MKFKITRTSKSVIIFSIWILQYSGQNFTLKNGLRRLPYLISSLSVCFLNRWFFSMCSETQRNSHLSHLYRSSKAKTISVNGYHVIMILFKISFINSIKKYLKFCRLSLDYACWPCVYFIATYKFRDFKMENIICYQF